jgi:hypothetical protein
MYSKVGVMNKVWVLIGVFLLIGCSNKSLYENIQKNNRSTCNKVPFSQYEKCIENTKKTYEEYERERKTL